MDEPMAESLPLTETTCYILLSLAAEPRHGYGIMKDVEGLSDGRVQFSTGTLYGALGRLLEEGWIARVPAERVGEPEDDRTRKYYELTSAGHKALEAEVRRLQELVQAAQLRHSGVQP